MLIQLFLSAIFDYFLSFVTMSSSWPHRKKNRNFYLFLLLPFPETAPHVYYSWTAVLFWAISLIKSTDLIGFDTMLASKWTVEQDPQDQAIIRKRTQDVVDKVHRILPKQTSGNDQCFVRWVDRFSSGIPDCLKYVTIRSLYYLIDCF